MTNFFPKSKKALIRVAVFCSLIASLVFLVVFIWAYTAILETNHKPLDISPVCMTAIGVCPDGSITGAICQNGCPDGSTPKSFGGEIEPAYGMGACPDGSYVSTTDLERCPDGSTPKADATF